MTRSCPRCSIANRTGFVHVDIDGDTHCINCGWEDVPPPLPFVGKNRFTVRPLADKCRGTRKCHECPQSDCWRQNWETTQAERREKAMALVREGGRSAAEIARESGMSTRQVARLRTLDCQKEPWGTVVRAMAAKRRKVMALLRKGMAPKEVARQTGMSDTNVYRLRRG